MENSNVPRYIYFFGFPGLPLPPVTVKIDQVDHIDGPSALYALTLYLKVPLLELSVYVVVLAGRVAIILELTQRPFLCRVSLFI